MFLEQLDRLRRTVFAPSNRDVIDTLSVQPGQLHTVLKNNLTLVDKLRQGTIDKVLAKSDLELGTDA